MIGNNEIRRRLSGSLLGMTALTLSTLAAAQDHADPAATLEEIVVTAQKREQSINDVGMSISAVSGDTLLARGIESAADLVKVVPGFSYTPTLFHGLLSAGQSHAWTTQATLNLMRE